VRKGEKKASIIGLRKKLDRPGILGFLLGVCLLRYFGGKGGSHYLPRSGKRRATLYWEEKI